MNNARNQEFIFLDKHLFTYRGKIIFSPVDFMFKALELMFRALKLLYKALGQVFQTLEHKILWGGRKNPLPSI